MSAGRHPSFARPVIHVATALILLLGGAIARGAQAPAGKKSAPPATAKKGTPPAAAKKGAPPPAAKASPPPPCEMDAGSKEVVQSLTDAMGGQQTWDRLPYFRFDFVVVKDGKEVARFKHWWDKAHGRCRVEGPDDQGQTVTAIFNLADRKGKAFTDLMLVLDTAPASEPFAGHSYGTV